MKARHLLLQLLAIRSSIATATLASLAMAATNQYWNVGGTGGDGIWGTGPGDKNWNLTPGAAAGNTTWADSTDNIAVFQDALGGTVTVFDPVQTNGLSLTGANYTLDAGVITLVSDASSAPFVNVQTGALTVNSLLAGSAGLTKTGGGSLVLSNANPLTGPIHIDGGALNLTGSLSGTDVQIAAGAGLLDANGGLAPATNLTNAGTLTVNAADTVASYTSNKGSLAGAGTLTTTSAFLNNGSTVTGLLETSSLFSSGSVAISGTINADTTTVTGGTIDLTGALASTTIDVTSGACLLDSSGGLHHPTALNNAGSVIIGADDRVARYTQQATGSLAGTGILTAATATLNGGTIAGHLESSTTITGDVLVSGSIVGLSLQITGGTTELTGMLNPSRGLSIAAGSTLLDESGGLSGFREPSRFTLSNSGTLTVQEDDTVRGYVQNDNGMLNGSAVLIAVNSTLNGGTIAGNLRGGTTTSTGDVLISGTLGGGSLYVNSGTLTLSGSAGNTTIGIDSGGTMIDANGGLDSDAMLVNRGILTINATDTIASLTNNAGTVNGTGALTVTGTTIFNGGKLAAPLTLYGTTSSLNDGTSVVGGLNCTTLTTNGTVAISGPVSATHGTVATGVLSLTRSYQPGTSPGSLISFSGSLQCPTVDIASGAELYDASGGLADNMTIANSGTLTMRANDAIASYISNGGTLAADNSVLSLSPAFSFLATDTGPSISEQSLIISPVPAPPALTTTAAALNDGSTVSGRLVATTLTSSGLVSITGGATADSIDITGGVLTNTGTLAATNQLNISSGAALVANGTQTYNLLTTSGSGTGAWQGDLTNHAVAAPGGIGGTGTLAVTGNLANGPSGILRMDLGTGLRDLVTVGGTATFGGTLDLNQLSPLTPFVPLQVVAAGSYAGNFTALTENLDGSAWFNPTDGTVMTLATPPTIGGTLWGTTANQTSAWVALYDDVIAPGVTNITHSPAGGYEITGGIADTGNPDLLNVLSASFVPGGLDAGLLNRLSPEVYAGFQDYAVEATRAHQRTALDAPALGFIQPPIRPDAKDAKHALPAAPAANAWEYFAVLEYFDAGTDSSPNQADYDLSGFGFVAGARTSLSDTIHVGGYLAADDGTVEGSLIDADACGWSLGLFAKALVHARTHTLITGGLSYGKYEFDGTRGSLIATGTGWTPANTGFSDVDSDALEFYLGASSLAYQTDRFRLIPSFGLRYVTGSMNGFAEAAGGPGSPIALVVGEDAYHSALAELSLRAEADLTAAITAHGLLGFRAAITDDPAALNARFTTGSRPQRATAAGLDGDAFFIGLGTTWRIRDNFVMGLNWRADFRDDADMENTVGLSTSIRF